MVQLGLYIRIDGRKDEAEESYKKYRRLKGKMDSLMSQEKN